MERIKPLVASTRTPEVCSSIGGFAGLMNLPKSIKDPVLVSGTDGVGTKLKIAFGTNQHSTIGIDLVAMCSNDVLTVGAKPLFFLDYFATGKLDVAQAEAVICGIAEGCRQAGCALIGGETAELPGFYQDNEYDLAGFCVGVVERNAILKPERIMAGDLLLGLPSSGLHSNGFSLARKALFEYGGLHLNDTPDVLEGKTLAEVLLTPTRIYENALRPALEHELITAACHITGGGIVENLPRVLPAHLAAAVRKEAWNVPAIFDLIQTHGSIADPEMRRTFNLGLGMILVVKEKDHDKLRNLLDHAGEPYFDIGTVVPHDGSADAPKVLFQ